MAASRIDWCAEDEPRYTRQHERTMTATSAVCPGLAPRRNGDEQDEDERGFHEHDGAQRAPRRNDCHERDVAGRQVRRSEYVSDERGREPCEQAERAGDDTEGDDERAGGRRRSSSPPVAAGTESMRALTHDLSI